MKRAPTQTEINNAELRVVQYRLLTNAALHRERIALRTAIARPSTLLTVGALSAIFGYGLGHRPRPEIESESTRETEPTRAKVPGLATAAPFIVAFIVRYAKEQLPKIVGHILASRQTHAEQVESDFQQVPKSDVIH